MLHINFIMTGIIHRSIIEFCFSTKDFLQCMMMESRCLEEEENIIKDARNIFRLEKLKKETTETTIKDIRNLFRIEKK